ncbi:hypothetical protein GCM10010201_35010 [Pilimelia columellifera subsp. columellifera]|uniref:DUF2742 domain-containing protein n=2 Tax=Pilimelia TaxID=53370 RepID=A0ABN3NRJ2_9ACTN
MDNHVQSAIDGAVPDGEGDAAGWEEGSAGDVGAEVEDVALPAVAQLGSSIRQAGWDQISGWPHDVAGFVTWPAPGQMATVTLSGAQWDLVVLALRHWADVDERLSDAAGAAKSRAVATALGRQLAARGWSPRLR